MNAKILNQIAYTLSKEAIDHFKTNKSYFVSPNNVLNENLKLIKKRANSFMDIQLNLTLSNDSRQLRVDDNGNIFLGD